MVDMRLNILDKYVDFFVISESTKTHQGENKKLNFDINNFPKFKNKIKYVIADYKKKVDFNNHEGGESLIEQHQRNFLAEGIKDAHPNDLIILSDSDEIPDLTKLKQLKKSTKFLVFSQMMFMYKLNLQNLNESNWMGSRLCLKKNFPKPQILRNKKFKEYPFWRIDKLGYQIIKGGWHFSFLQKPSDIVLKIKSYSHGEFNQNQFVDLKKIEQKINNNEDIFDRNFNLQKIKIDENYPEFIRKNTSLLKDWIL